MKKVRTNTKPARSLDLGLESGDDIRKKVKVLMHKMFTQDSLL